MKKLVVYYSMDGNTAFIAKAIAGAIEADVLELKLVDQNLYQGSFKKYFFGGRDAMCKNMPDLAPLARHPQDYDVLFIGSPVWALTYAPALETFFKTEFIEDKKVGLFCSHNGGKGKILQQMAQRLAKNKIIGLIDFIDPLKGNQAKMAEKAIHWAREVLSKA